jgi:hypothetical protein
MTLVNKALKVAEESSIRNYIVSKKAVSAEGISPFETRFIMNETHVGIPENIIELVQSNYLIRLWLITIQQHDKMILHACPGYKDTSIITKEQTEFLHGWGVHVVRGELARFQSDARGPFKNGMLIHARHIVGKVKNCDPRWFKFHGFKSIIQELFGVAWATSHKFEKRLLDFIMSVSAGYKININDVLSYILPEKDVKKLIGLSAKLHKNKVLSEDEQKWLEEDYKDYLEAVRAFKYPNFGSPEEFVAFQMKVATVLKAGKRYKEMTDSVVNNRLKLLYAGNKQQKAQKKKIPVTELISRTKGTREYLETFNPCRIGNTPHFTVSMIPEKPEEQEKVRVMLEAWAINSTKKTHLEGRVNSIKAWFLIELGL